jgi:hypothetical protein
MEGFFGFPLFGVDNPVLQRVFVGKPAARAAGAEATEVEHGAKEFDQLGTVFKRGAKAYHGENRPVRMWRRLRRIAALVDFQFIGGQHFLLSWRA